MLKQKRGTKSAPLLVAETEQISKHFLEDLERLVGLDYNDHA